MTVLCFADTRFPIERANGVQTIETCHALAGRGHDVTLITRPDAMHPPRDPLAFYDLPPMASLRFAVIAARGTMRARRLRFLVGAVRLAAAHRPAVVFTRDLGLAAWLLRIPRARRPRVVYESHGHAGIVAKEMPALLGDAGTPPSDAKLRRLGRREARVWARAAAYVCITQALADELIGRYGPRPRLFVVPDAARQVGAFPPPARDRFLAGYAGHLYPWKGVDVFVRALVHAPDVHGLIVGGHPGEADVARVRALVSSLGLDDRVTITGLLSRAEVPARLAPASVLVLPNPRSAIAERYMSPLKLFEYLAAGRPIVASDLPAIREVLADGETALLVPPGDERALGAALVRLRADPALADRLGAAARARAADFTWEARAARLEAALQAALSA